MLHGNRIITIRIHAWNYGDNENYEGETYYDEEKYYDQEGELQASIQGEHLIKSRSAYRVTFLPIMCAFGKNLDFVTEWLDFPENRCNGKSIVDLHKRIFSRLILVGSL